jgi:hypothetical protein
LILLERNSSMNMNKHPAVTIGLVCGSAVAIALAGCATYDRSSTYSDAPEQGFSAYVEIRTEGDFYEPLSPYGRWEVVGSYGRCWIPDRVGADWGPYEDGYWRLTDDGWYWESTEPWGWATYHYGRWDSDPRYGWFWVPQTRWGPAWVSWRHGGGYTGWAPMGPTGRAAERHDRRGSHDGAYVFVEDRQFLEPVRHQTVVVNTTVINRAVIDERPSTAAIERASGRKVQATPARDLRRNAEAAIKTKHVQPEAPEARRAQPPNRLETGRVETKGEARRGEKAAPPQVAPRPAPVKQEAAQAAPKHSAKPVAGSPTRPVELRASEKKAIQSPPVTEKPRAEAKHAVRTKTKPAAEAAPAPVVTSPPPKTEEPEQRKKKGADGTEERENHDDGNRGR